MEFIFNGFVAFFQDIIKYILAFLKFIALAIVFLSYFYCVIAGGGRRRRPTRRELSDSEYDRAINLWSKIPPGRWVDAYEKSDPEFKKGFYPSKYNVLTFDAYWKFILNSIIFIARKISRLFKKNSGEKQDGGDRL